MDCFRWCSIIVNKYDCGVVTEIQVELNATVFTRRSLSLQCIFINNIRKEEIRELFKANKYAFDDENALESSKLIKNFQV